MAPLKANPLLIKASVSTLHFLQGASLILMATDYYSCNLGSNLVVHSHHLHLFLPLGLRSGQLLNVKAHASISAQLQRLEFSTPPSFPC